MDTRILNNGSPRGRAVIAAYVIVMLATATASAQSPPREAVTPGSKPPWRRVLQGDDSKRVRSLEEQAADLEKNGRFAEAIAPALEVLAIRGRAQGEDHWETVTARVKAETFARLAGLSPADQSEIAATLRQIDEADKLYGEGHYAEAEAILRRALAIRLKVLGEEHTETATIYNKLINSLADEGKYAEAEPLVRKALEIRRKLLGEDHPDTAESLNDLAVILNIQGKHAEAQPFYRRALAVRRDALGEDDHRTANTYDNLAASLADQGKYAEAEPLIRKALAIYRRARGQDHPDTATSYDNLTVILNLQGKYAEAEPLHRKVLEIRRRVQGDEHPDTTISANTLAMNLGAQRKWIEAESLLEKALTVRRRVLGEDHPLTAQNRNNLAVNLDAQGKSAEAEPLYRMSLASGLRTLAEDHPDVVRSDFNLARNLNAQGKYAEAEPLFRKALEIKLRQLGEGHPIVASCRTELAASLAARGRYDEAEAMALAAARSYDVARLRVSFAGLDRAEFASDRSPLPLVAALMARRGRDQDAWQHWESGLARGLFDDLSARRLERLTTDERHRRDELVDRVNRLDNLIGALAGAEDRGGDRLKRLVDLKDRRLEWQGRLAQFEAGLVEKYRVAAGAAYPIAEIQARLPAGAALVGWLDLKSMPGADDPRGEHWACILRSRGAPRWVRIPGTGPGQAWTPADDRRPGEARRLLVADDATAWRQTLADLARQRLAPLEPALAARDGLPGVDHLIVLPSPALAGIPIEAMLESRPAESTPRRLVSYSPSGTLFAWLQERSHEKKGVPERPRRLLALGDPVPPPSDEAAPKPPDQGLLVQHVDPGSSAEQAGIRPGDVLLRYARAPLTARDDLPKQVQAVDPGAASVAVSIWREGRTIDLALRPGPPGIGLDDQPAARAILARREGDALLRRSRGAAFKPLPGSRREVGAIAGLFDRSDVYLGSDASEQTLESLRAQGILDSFTVIHLATHGEIDDLSPMNSRLLLSQDKLPDPIAAPSIDAPAYDGILRAGEVMSTWKLNAELVTLSACGSGLGRPGGGEGFIGFAQAFFLAGSRGVLVSLWEVDDLATSLLMTRFYQNWMGKRRAWTGRSRRPNRCERRRPGCGN